MKLLMKNVLVVGLSLFVLGANCEAGELKPTLGKVGELVAEGSFEGGELGKEWAAAKGDWKIVDGALSGAEMASDKHAAVVGFVRPNTDSVVGFRFKLDGTEWFSFSLNHAKGHLLRVNVGLGPTSSTRCAAGDTRRNQASVECQNSTGK